MRTLSRLLATTLVALTASATLTSAPATADASRTQPATRATSTQAPAAHTRTDRARAERPRARRNFIKPAEPKFVRATCRRTPDAEYIITFTFRLTGGRYANIGNAVDGFKNNDKVYRGGRRLFHGSNSYADWSGQAIAKPPSHATVEWDHAVSPLNGANNVGTWKVFSGETTKAVNCPDGPN